MKLTAFLFATFVLYIVVQADRGSLPSFLAAYREIPYGDTLGHFFLIGTLAFLVNASILTTDVSLLGRPFYKGSLVVCAVVFLEELSQIGLENRTFSLLDLAADLCGICLADRLLRLWRSRS